MFVNSSIDKYFFARTLTFGNEIVIMSVSGNMKSAENKVKQTCYTLFPNATVYSIREKVGAELFEKFIYQDFKFLPWELKLVQPVFLKQLAFASCDVYDMVVNVSSLEFNGYIANPRYYKRG